ncbi:MAG: hypothetical protein IKH33_02790 [Bacteroidales bacterium]|nr:hypothetical protein [Bacteroidales bacterium]
MAESKNKNLGFHGRIRGLGVTFYQRGGRTYARVSTRSTSNKQSLGQFKVRERMRHSIALWKSFYTPYEPLMDTSGGLTAYNAFLRANSALPTAYLTKQQARQGAALLMPGMVVSEGRLPAVEYDFAVLESGERVVLTDLLTGIDEGETRELTIRCNDDLRQLLCSRSRNPQLMHGDKVRFYRFEQRLKDDCPTVKMSCCEMALDNDPRQNPALRNWRFYSHEGRLAIGGADDENRGWAVVIYGEKEQSASTQQVITTCRLYEQYTTDEALAQAAESYGNVEKPDMLTPDLPKRKMD